jgi:transglutaminase superfamily protein
VKAAAHLTRLWRVSRSLGPDARRLVVEAAVLLGFVWVGLRILSFAKLRHALDRCATRPGRGSRSSRSQIGWAVGAAGRRLPGRTCLMEALVADVMLRRRGYNSELHLGIRKTSDPSQPLDAHAWVESEGGIVVGALETLAQYTLQSGIDRGSDR